MASKQNCSSCKNHKSPLIQQCAAGHTAASKSCPTTLTSNNNEFFEKFMNKETDSITTHLKTLETKVDSQLAESLPKNGSCLNEYSKFLYDQTKKDWETRRKRVLHNGILLYKIPEDKASRFAEFEKDEQDRVKSVKDVRIGDFVNYIGEQIGKENISAESCKLMSGSFVARDKIYVKMGHKTKDAAIKILRKRSSLNSNHGIDWCFSADRDRLINNKLGALKLNATMESYFWTIEGAQLVLVNQGMPLKNQNATKAEKRKFSCNIHNPNIDLFHNNISFNSLKSLEKFDNYVNIAGDIASKSKI